MCGPEMAGSSPREREVGSLWCSAYPRLVGVTSPDSCPHPFVNPFTRHSSLSSFLPSFLPSLSRILLIVVPLSFSSSTFLHLERTPRLFTFILQLPEIVMFLPTKIDENRSCDKRGAFSSIFERLKETF